MSKPASKKPHGNPNLAKVRPKGKGSVKGRTRSGTFPKYLEDFCQNIFSGHSAIESASMIGRSPGSAYYLFSRPDVQERLVAIKEEYGKLRVQAQADPEILTDRFIKEQLVDAVHNGEGKGKHGRLRAIEIAARVNRLIDPPNAQTIVAMNMAKMVGGKATFSAPKFYEANRFLKLKQAEPTPEDTPDA